MNLQKRLVFFIIILSLSFDIYPENRESKQPFLSFGVGSSTSSYEDFTFIRNLAIYYPITSKNFYVFGKFQYGSKERALPPFNPSDISTSVGTSFLKTWNYYLGLQYDFTISEKSLWFVNIGGVKAYAKDKIISPYGEHTTSSNEVLLFLGTGYEHKIYKNLSAFVEGQYNLSSKLLIHQTTIFDNLNISVGIHYYLK